MGVVWRAIDERLERSVAVKQILAQPGLSEAERDNMRQRAMREAKNAARFQHPNAIVVFDIAEHGGDPCLVMEYLEGRSLSALLAEQPTLPLAQVARIGEQVASALVAAHRAGIVHRDVKPGNILLDDHGTTKITDFGISRAAGDMALTQTGLIGGTPAYLAPELARGSDPVPSSDVFALGATLYQALEGTTPYGDTSNQLALLYAAANGQIQPPRQSGAATALLMSLLRNEPADRPTMAEARDRLAALARNEPTPQGGMVSPPLFNSGNAGRRPAVTDTPGRGLAGGVRPPWQRVEPKNPQPAVAQAASPAPPMTKSLGAPPSTPAPTAAYIPPRPAQQPPPPAPPRRPARPAAGGGGGMDPDTKRKTVMFAGAGAAVVVIAVIVFVALSSGGDGGNQQAGGTTPSTSAPAGSGSPKPTPSTAPSSSQVSSNGKVEWGSAGSLIVEFYDFPGNIAGAWGKLTPGAQQVYGTQEAFQAYWSQYKNVFAKTATAYKHANNEDGSVDIQFNLNHDGQAEQKIVRVINSTGGLLIDGDTKVGGVNPS